METLQFQFSGGAPHAGRACVGVVGSGDLEVLATPGQPGQIRIEVTTSVNGMSAIWQAQFNRIFAAHFWPSLDVTIHDFGATPAVVRLRLEQIREVLASTPPSSLPATP